MFDCKDVAVQIGYPLLTFLSEPQIFYGVCDIGLHGVPVEPRIPVG